MTSQSRQEEMNLSSDRGWRALELEDFQTAETAYRHALQISRELKDRPAEAVFLSYLALALKGELKPDESRLALEEALSIAESEDDARLIGHSSYLLAELDCEESDESAAIARLWRSLDSALEAADAGTAEVSLGKLGEIYRNRGWLEQAAECFRQAAEIGSGTANRIAWLGNLGQTLAEMGDMKGSLTRFHEALELAEEQGDEKSKAACLSSEALVHFEKGDFEGALARMQAALQIVRKIEDRRAESSLLGNLGNVFLKLRHADEAAAFCREALDLARATGDKRSAAAHLDTLGDYHMDKGEVEKALGFYSKALQEAISIGDRLGERVYRANNGKALRKMGKASEAMSELAHALELFEEQRARIIQSDRLKTSFAAAGLQIYRDMIALCLETGKRVEALEYVGRAKSRAILDLLANSPIDISEMEKLDDSSIAILIQKEFELRGQIASLERLFGRAESETGNRGLNAAGADVSLLYDQWRDVVDQLRRRHPSYASMISVDPLSFQDMSALWRGEQALLRDSDAVLEFFWSENLFLSSALWSGIEQPQLQIIPEEEQLEIQSDIYDFLEMSSTEGWEVPLGLCRRLYEKLLAPLVSALPASIERIILVPHGILHKLPFAALHDGQKYLIEKYSLSILPSSSLIKLLGERRQKLDIDQQKYLISAISDYSATRDEGINFGSRLRSSYGLEDLSYTLEEGRNVFGFASKVVPDSQFLFNEQVKDALLEKFREYSVIHFAGHAIFNPEEPLASGLVLADGSLITAARILQDSSFRTERGRLLILSACQTGVNVITSGGEIVGLARAIFYAGMPNLISSLWEVADMSTAELMQDFHNFWQAGKTSIADALRQAQTKALNSGLPVHAWAPFMHLGID